jgi:hypothetical protein
MQTAGVSAMQTGAPFIQCAPTSANHSRFGLTTFALKRSGERFQITARGSVKDGFTQRSRFWKSCNLMRQIHVSSSLRKSKSFAVISKTLTTLPIAFKIQIC